LIAKHISMRSVRKSSFAELVAYITDTQGKVERLENVNIANCRRADVEWAIREVRSTQQQNTRAESDKTYHLLIGFPAGEIPSPEMLQAIEQRVCSALGYGEHQRISAVHNDTDNLHIHVAINKIHPNRLTMHEPYRDYKILGEICTKLENEYNLQRVNHGARKQGAQNRADDMEHMAGVESLIGWVKRECLGQIYGVQTWSDFHELMQANGLEIRERGNGFVIGDRSGTNVKASSIARDLSKTKLEARLGPFKPVNEAQDRMSPAREYQVKPMPSRTDTTELYAKYKAEQQSRLDLRAKEWAKARNKKKQLIEAAKGVGRRKRATIKLLDGGGLSRKVLYGLTSKTLRAEVEQINKQYLKERQDIYNKCQRLAWNDWLQKQATGGDSEALEALRAREARQGLKGDTIAGKGAKHAERGFDMRPASTTKVGTVIYEVGTAVIRDDGERLKVSRGAAQDGLEVALRMAMHRYGKDICVTGSDEFKERIARAAAVGKLNVTFDDEILESRRRALLVSLSGKEANRGRQNHRQQQGPGADRGRPEVGGRVTLRSRHLDGIEAVRGSRAAAGRHSKPNVGAVGRRPPPEGQNRLRNMSQLGVVRIPSGAEVLLQGDVPGDLEHQGTQSNNGVRWSVPRPGLTAEQLAAADKYIGERADKRAQGLSVAKHKRYEPGAGDSGVYGGCRRIDGQCLVLLEHADEVMVLPVDEATARRVEHMPVGTAVIVTPQGSVKSKGRGR
jgi:Fe-S cluster biosynthesis and repair protein YggX